MSRVFVTQVVPRNEVGNLGVSQAANNFCFKIGSLPTFEYHISTPPIHISRKNNFSDNDVEYIMFRRFKHKSFGKLFNILIENVILFNKLKLLKTKSIWFYNVYPPNILAYLLCSMFLKRGIFVIFADYNPKRYNFFVRHLIKMALVKSKGIISLSGRCDLNNSNMLVIPGIINIEKPLMKFKKYPTNSYFISGTLNENTGILLALEAFSKMSDSELYISGTGSESIINQIENYCSKFNNLHFLGYFETYSEYCVNLMNMDVVLSLRNPCQNVNNFNFPSKILEALQYGKLVLSTIEYPELKSIDYYNADYNLNSLMEIIEKINKDTNLGKNSNWPSKNYDKLIKLFSPEAWSHAISKIEYNKL